MSKEGKVSGKMELFIISCELRENNFTIYLDSLNKEYNFRWHSII